MTRRTSTCGVCGRFLSAGSRHDLATTCRPPVEPTPTLRLPAIRSPFQAWPAEHLHHGREGRYVTTPLPGLGPRLVEVLARHRASVVPPDARSRRYGPAAALRELLAAGPAAALEAVLEPASMPVHCDDDWHRVGLTDGELDLLDHSGLDVDSELVAAALTGQAPVGCLRVAQLWQHRDGVGVHRLLGSLPVFEAARRWHEAGESLESRDPWIAEAWRPVLLERAREVDVDEVEVLRWLSVTRAPEQMRAWRDAGWTVREAGELLVHLSAAESGAWRAAGLDVNRIHEARRGGLSLDEAAAWHRAGWPLLTAAALAAQGCGLVDAEKLLAAVGRRGQVVALVRGGLRGLGAEQMPAGAS